LALYSTLFPYTTLFRSGGGAGTDFPVWFASGSIVLNFGSEKSFYILGGYSAMDFNSNAAGGFRDVGAHGAIGDRIFITDRVALRDRKSTRLNSSHDQIS